MINSNGALREQIIKAITNQSQQTVTVLSSLLAVEDEIGYIPPVAIEEVALHNEASINDVWAVASFYTNFRFTPLNKRVIEVCWGPTCHINGAQNLLHTVQTGLGLTGEGDTEDGGVTLKYNTCLGACPQAPVIMVDHEIIGKMTKDHLKEIIADLTGQKNTT